MRKVLLTLAAVASLVPAVASAQLSPVRVGGNVQAPERITYVAPAYPEAAKAARVSGIVILEAIVGTDGRVAEAKVIRSIAQLDEAALDAVRQWKYTPTTLNGQPVPVIMTVTVNFTMATGGSNIAAGSGMSDNSFAAGHPLAEPTAAPEPIFLNGREAIRIGGNIKAPERTHYAAPAYPQAAQDARVQGVVIVEAVIDENGSVAQTKVLRSVALLDEAALEAVSKWKYTPTYLNGSAVPVVMTVTINFTVSLN